MRSLRSRLLLLWAVSLLAALAAALPLVGLYRAQDRALEGREEIRLARACDAIADRFAYYVAGWAGPDAGPTDPEFRAGLRAVQNAALQSLPDIATAIWQQDSGLLLPERPDPALRAALEALAAEAVSEDRPADQRLAVDGVTLLLRACPLAGPVAGLAAIVQARADAAPGLAQARFGITVLASLVLATTIGVGFVLVTYAKRIGAIEAALSAAGPALPRLPMTGERDLDRIVAAFNRAADGLDAARQRESALAARVTEAERLAALGRVAAGVAHELRNPLAAMRLRAENALAGDAARAVPALEAVLAQIARLDRLAGELLDMTRARTPAPAPVSLRALLHAEAPANTTIDAPDATLALDADLFVRALGNLLRNAARAAGPDGRITLTAGLDAGTLTVTVADTGPGVPDALRETLFEPFATGHADGTGLGLAIAREAARAMGGSLSLVSPGGSDGGAVFRLTVPV
jgi:signal transduction histidine kinase